MVTIRYICLCNEWIQGRYRERIRIIMFYFNVIKILSTSFACAVFKPMYFKLGRSIFPTHPKTTMAARPFLSKLGSRVREM